MNEILQKNIKKMRFNFKDLDGIKTTFSRITRKYANGEIDENFYKLFSRSVKIFIDIEKVKQEKETKERLERIEKYLSEKK